jgi:hypothetical protein
VPELDTLMRKGFLASWGCLHLRAGQLCDVLRHFCDLFLAEWAAAGGGGRSSAVATTDDAVFRARSNPANA